MFCPKCGTELEEGDYKCLKCKWSWSEIETDIEKTTLVDKEQKKNSTNKIKNLPKTKKIIVCVFIVVLILCLMVSIFGNKNKLIGKWENGQVGYIIFTENGQFFVDNDNISGAYKVDGSTITIYKENGNIEYWEFDISNNILTMTYNNETIALYKSK